MKRRYQLKFTQRAVDLLEYGQTENLYNVDLYLARTFVNEILNEMTNEIFFNCREKSLIVYE